MIIKKILLSKEILPVHALLLGYMLWLAAAYSTSITTTCNLPVYIYNNTHEYTFTAPEYIQAVVQLPRFILSQLQFSEPALYINAQDLHLGDNNILAYSQQISLPDKANVLKLVPGRVNITVSSSITSDL